MLRDIQIQVGAPDASRREDGDGVAEALIDGVLSVPHGAVGAVLFAHGSGSSRHSRRNRAVAAALQEVRLATLLLDLLTPAEEIVDERSRMFRFDIPLLADRLGDAVRWLQTDSTTRALPIGLFGASTGAAAALVAAAQPSSPVRAVVSRGGRPDLAGHLLYRVRAPTLLIVGGNDVDVLRLNRAALHQLGGPAELAVVAGATHLFEEPGALKQVGSLARSWFLQHLQAATVAHP